MFLSQSPLLHMHYFLGVTIGFLYLRYDYLFSKLLTATHSISPIDVIAKGGTFDRQRFRRVARDLFHPLIIVAVCANIQHACVELFKIRHIWMLQTCAEHP